MTKDKEDKIVEDKIIKEDKIDKEEKDNKKHEHTNQFCKFCKGELETVYPLRVMDDLTLMECKDCLRKGLDARDYRTTNYIPPKAEVVKEKDDCPEENCDGKLHKVMVEVKLKDDTLYECDKCKGREYL